MLSGRKISEYVNRGYIHISPFDEKNVNPNSYNVRLSDTLLTYTASPMVTIDWNQKKGEERQGLVLDCKAENPTTSFTIDPEKGIVLVPGTLYLGSTIEEVGSDYFVPKYDGRSSTGRMGIQSHLTAGFGDVGFKRRWTLEIMVVHPVRVYTGMAIGQISFTSFFFDDSDHDDDAYFSRVKESVTLYNGKYKDQDGPQPSKFFRDFRK